MITRHPWTGVLCKVRTISSDHRMLALSPLAQPEYRDLPLPLLSTLGAPDLSTGVGTVEQVWLHDDAVWATGKIQLNPDSPVGERMLNRIPQPVGVNLAGGDIEEHDSAWRHHIDRLLGHDHPPVQVCKNWVITAVHLVAESCWPDAFITLDDNVEQRTPELVAAGHSHTRW